MVAPQFSVFRGFTAAASLKALIVRVSGPVQLTVFRGFTAAASLKGPDLEAFLGVVLEVFRGFTAAASLKGGDDRRSQPCLRSFPRFHRRGLIEGLGRTILVTNPLRFSAVSPPRPH